jgi:TonB family protein
MMRFLPVLALGLTVQPAAAFAPAQPTDKWALFYEENVCAAQRTFGEYKVGFARAPLGKTTRWVVQGPGRAARARQYDSVISVDDGGPGIKTSSLVYPLPARGRRGITTILSTEDSQRVERSKRLQISTLGEGVQSRRSSPDGSEVFEADLALGDMSVLSREMDKCMDDLRRHWGIVDGRLPVPAKQAREVDDVRTLFTADDYPEDAITGGQSGTTIVTLLIDEKGAVIDCVVTQSSGVASIDGMVCQVMRQRAKFAPARDASGNPVKDMYTTPPVRFQIYPG